MPNVHFYVHIGDKYTAKFLKLLQCKRSAVYIGFVRISAMKEKRGGQLVLGLGLMPFTNSVQI